VEGVVVTGIGVISSIGSSVAATHQALLSGHCGLSALELFETRYARLLRFGEIKLTNDVLIDRTGATEAGVTRTSLLALHAAQEALSDSGLSIDELSSGDTALIIGNTVGGMCLTDQLYADGVLKVGSPYLGSYDSGSVTIYLQKKLGINGICNTINTACSSSLNAIIYGTKLIRNGFAKRAIVGGTDSLAKFTINGFNALGILSTSNCRPFDESRDGLNLGEGAGFLVLEKEEDIRNKKSYAYIGGYANANDAFHPSSLSPEGKGPQLVMQRALTLAGINAADISYINTHGTATPNNDEVESMAMISVFGNNVPDFVSSKSKIGHTLGAAGAVESVFSLLAMQHGEIYPGAGFSQPISQTGLIPVTAHKKKTLKHVMNNSFGFGGNCSSVIYSAT
jgi:3-oxoacyl-(acyl-carrier-protein) synthase